MIQYSIRQIRFLASDECNPKNLQTIANKFKVGNSRACHFALYYVYGLNGKDIKAVPRHSPNQSYSLFLYFEPQQMTKAESMAQSLGISFSELCKRAISSVSNMIETNKLKDTDSKVSQFFQE